MSSNPGPTAALTSDRVSSIVATVTGVIGAIEQIVSASGLGGSLSIAQIEQLTNLFGNLAGVAIQAAHDVFGWPVTPESVLALMPVTTPLVEGR
jgi:hypothetical protein